MRAVFDAPKPRPDLGRGFDIVEAASRMVLDELLDVVAAIRNRVEITACDSQGTEVALHDHVAVAGFLRRVYMIPMQFEDTYSHVTLPPYATPLRSASPLSPPSVPQPLPSPPRQSVPPRVTSRLASRSV